jgi:hypothetical protein
LTQKERNPFSIDSAYFELGLENRLKNSPYAELCKLMNEISKRMKVTTTGRSQKMATQKMGYEKNLSRSQNNVEKYITDCDKKCHFWNLSGSILSNMYTVNNKHVCKKDPVS